MPARRIFRVLPSIGLLTLLLSTRPLPASAVEVTGTWEELPAPTLARARAAYDPLRQRMLVFDGTLWALDLAPGGVWSHFLPLGTPPPDLAGAAVVLDPPRDRLLFVLGTAAGLPAAQSVWALTLDDTPTWQSLTIGGTTPVVRAGAGAVHDPSGDRVVLFGGEAKDPIAGKYLLADAWALTFDPAPAWTPLATSGLHPPVTKQPAVVYDGARDRLVFTTPAHELPGTAWFLDLSGDGSWSVRDVGMGPPAENDNARIYDPVGDRLIVFGGCCDSTLSSVAQTWQLPLAEGGAWTLLATEGGSPPALSGAAAIHDPVHARFVMQGGLHRELQQAYLVASYLVNDVWRLELAGAPAWSRIGLPTEGPPDPLSAAFGDAQGRRMIGFAGGQDLWIRELDGAWRWSKLRPTGSGSVPVAEDREGGRLFSFGNALTPIRVLDMATNQWTSVPTSGGPTDFTLGVAAWDGEHQRLFAYGQNRSPLTGSLYPTTWILPFAPGVPAVWEEHATPEPRPPGGRVWRLFYDAPRDRVVAFGDRDVYTLDAGSPGPWTLYSSVLPAIGPAVVYDGRRDRYLLMGGNIGGGPMQGVHSLRFMPAPVDQYLQSGPSLYEPKLFFDARRDRLVMHGGIIPRYERGFRSNALTFSDPVQPTLTCGGDVVWTPGASVPVDYLVGNASATGGTLSYRLEANRDWPGLPLTGTFELPGGGSTPLQVAVPVPDSASAGAVVLRLWVGEPFVPEAGAWCTRHLHDVATPTRIALVETEVGIEGGGVRLVWWADGEAAGSAVIERRVDGGDHEERGRVVPESGGRIEFVDRDVTPGAVYFYRAGVAAEAGPEWSAESRVEIPRAAGFMFGLAGSGTRLVTGACDVAFSLAVAGPVELAAFDIRGRRVAVRSEPGLPAGPHVARIAEPGMLGPGLYFVRLRQGAAVATGKFIVLGTR